MALRQISTRAPIPIVQTVGDGQDPGRPLIIRKGRNTLAQLCGGTNDIKKFWELLLDSFGGTLQTQPLSRPTQLADKDESVAVSH